MARAQPGKSRPTRCGTVDCRVSSSLAQQAEGKVSALKRTSPTHEGAHMKAADVHPVARGGLVSVALALSLLLAPAAHSDPFIWDDDNDAIDDRIESVQLLGYRFSFENGDTLLQQRFE